MGCQAEAESLEYNDDGDYSGDDSLYEAGNYSYEYYEDIYENYDQGEPLAHSGEVESVLDYVPEMMTAPLSLEVSVGQRLELPCSAKVKENTRFDQTRVVVGNDAHVSICKQNHDNDSILVRCLHSSHVQAI